MTVQSFLGYLPDLISKKDHIFENMMMGTSSAPSEYTKLADGYDLTLQQHAESCVGYSITEGLYAAWVAQGIVKPKLASPLFIWRNARQRHGAEKLNSGTYIRLAIKQLTTIGFCPNDEWDGFNGNDFAHFDERPSRASYRAAFDQKMTNLEYYRINSSGESLVESWKSALSQNCPIVFGVPLRESFMDLRSHTTTDGGSGRVVGGHALCGLGYDREGAYCPNTWGPGHGNQGWIHFSWKFLMESAQDQWALRVPRYFSA